MDGKSNINHSVMYIFISLNLFVPRKLYLGGGSYAKALPLLPVQCKKKAIFRLG